MDNQNAPSSDPTPFLQWLDQQQGRQYDLHADHINPAFVKMLRAIGFDKRYVRGEGPYLWDKDGNKYLDLLTGWGVFALGRNHPKIRAILQQLMNRDLPNLVRMDCGLPSGLVAEKLTQNRRRSVARLFLQQRHRNHRRGAIKFARCMTGRQKIVYCEHGFHGLTTGSLALNGADFFRARFGDLLPGTEKVPFNDLPALEMILRNKDAAAFIVEPACKARAAKSSPMDISKKPKRRSAKKRGRN